MFSRFFSFISEFLSEAGDASSKRLAMLSTVFSALMVFILAFWLQKEIPNSAMTLIITLITSTSTTYTITRFKEDGGVSSVEKTSKPDSGEEK